MSTRSHFLRGAFLAFAAAVVAGSGPVTGQSSTGSPGVSGAFANLSGRQIWYVDTGGSGVPIVFLHAGTGSTVVWEHQIPAVTAAGYRFVAYDRLGSGQSVLADGTEPGTAVDDLKALTDYLRLSPFHLVGTAAGGIVALDYSLSFPERLRSLVIANSIGGVSALTP